MTFVYRVTYRPIFNGISGREIRGKLLKCNVACSDTDEAYHELIVKHRDRISAEPLAASVERLQVYECRWLLDQSGGLIDFDPVAISDDWIAREEESRR